MTLACTVSTFTLALFKIMASAAATANPLGAAASEDGWLSDMVPYCRVQLAVGFWLFERLDGSRATCRMGKNCRKLYRWQSSSSKQLLTTGNVKGYRQSNGPGVTGKTWLRFVFGPEKKQILVLPARGHSLHVGCCSSLSTLVSQM